MKRVWELDVLECPRCHGPMRLLAAIHSPDATRVSRPVLFFLHSQTSWFRWACDDPRDIEKFGWRLERSRTFCDAGAELVRCLPWTLPVLVRYFRWLPLRDMHGYRLNRLRVRP
jgi:hypothetical protein